MHRILFIFSVPLFTKEGLKEFVTKMAEVAKWYSDTNTSASHAKAWADMAKALDKALDTYDAKVTFEDAKAVFDQLTGATYWGAQFREALFTDPEAMAAARYLVSRLRIRRVPGIDGPPSSPPKSG
jgi:hypothetical protein